MKPQSIHQAHSGMSALDVRDRSHRVVRVGKYIIPIEALYPSSYGYAAPTNIASLEQLEQQHPEQVSVLTGPIEPAMPEYPFEVLNQGQWTTKRLAPFPAQQNRVHVIRGAASIGRNCCLLGPQDQIIAETGFYLDAQELAQTLTMGRLHPHYWRYRWQGDLRSRWSLPKRRFLPGSVAPINNRCSHNYYHWMTEVAPRITALHMVGLQPDWYLVDCQSGFQRQVLEMLGIAPEKIVQPHCALHVGADQMYYVKEVSPSVTRQFAATLRQRLGLPDRSTGRQLYISRLKARHRKVEKEHQIEAHLQQRGFDCVCFEDLKCKDQFRLISESATILTTHGAALANVVFAAPGSRIIELFPQRRLNIDLYPHLSRICGVEHRTQVCQSTRFLQRIRVDIRDIELLLELPQVNPRMTTTEENRAA